MRAAITLVDRRRHHDAQGRTATVDDTCERACRVERPTGRQRDTVKKIPRRLTAKFVPALQVANAVPQSSEAATEREHTEGIRWTARWETCTTR